MKTRSIFFMLVSIIALAHFSYAENPLQLLKKAQRTIVHIEAETGVLAKEPAAPFLDPNTGAIFVKRSFRGLQSKRTGTGIIIDPSGLILTNAHTVASAKHIFVTLNESEDRYAATPVYMAAGRDLIFLKIDVPYPLAFAVLADSDETKLNDPVYSIGGSHLLMNTISGGKIIGTAQHRGPKEADDPVLDMLKIDFDVYKGDSGSPILNGEGELLGFIVAGNIKRGGATYAVSANAVRKHYENYLEKISPESAAAKDKAPDVPVATTAQSASAFQHP